LEYIVFGWEKKGPTRKKKRKTKVAKGKTGCKKEAGKGHGFKKREN